MSWFAHLRWWWMKRSYARSQRPPHPTLVWQPEKSLAQLMVKGRDS